MTDQPTPETAAKLADDPQPSSDSPDYARALEIHIHLLRAERDDAAALAKNYAERMKRSDAELAEARALLGLLADIRAAVGDPTGKLMQDELVERCRKLRADRDMWQADAKQRLADRVTLRAALELIAAPMRPDGTYNRDRTACGSIARAALNQAAQ